MKAYRLFHVIDNASSSMPMRQWGQGQLRTSSLPCTPSVPQDVQRMAPFPSYFFMQATSLCVCVCVCVPNCTKLYRYFTFQKSQIKSQSYFRLNNEQLLKDNILFTMQFFLFCIKSVWQLHIYTQSDDVQHKINIFFVMAECINDGDN